MLDWVGSSLLLVGVWLLVKGEPKYMPLAMILNLLGDLILTVFFSINFNLPMLMLNIIYAGLALYGYFKWSKQNEETKT